MLRRVTLIAGVCSCLFGLVASARADLVVTIGSASISPGGTGSVDVTIESTNPNGDPLAHFGFEFLITPTSPRQLSFLNPQLDAQLSLPSYVFFGNSADLIEGLPVGNVLSTGGGTDNEFLGGDDTENGSDVLVTTSRLLVQLNLTTLTGSPPPVPGDSFEISLFVPDPQAQQIVTFFLNSDFQPIAFSSTPGTVGIEGGTPTIPEPSALVLLALGGPISVLVLRRCIQVLRP